MHTPFRSARTFAVASLCLSLAACSGVVDNTGGATESNLATRPPVTPLAAPTQSFMPFDDWGGGFTAGQGWGSENPVLFGHVDADNKSDFVGFGNDGVWVGFSGDTRFRNIQYVLADFGVNQGWSVERHVRLLGDINGDGLDDVVGFGDAGVYTALSDGSGFPGPAHFVLADLGYNQGWRVDTHTRILADVDGDGCKDIVGFGYYGVAVAFSDCAGGFAPLAAVINDLGALQGWTASRDVRMTGDLDGDGRADIVAFGQAGVYTALSTGRGYANGATLVTPSFGGVGNWGDGLHERTLGDINADGRPDIVAITPAGGVYTALSLGDGTFASAVLGITDSSLARAVVTDLNGDGSINLLAYWNTGWVRSLGSPGGFSAKSGVLYAPVYPGHWTIADVDGNGMSDVVVFTATEVHVARSTSSSAPPPPAAPSNIQVTVQGSTSILVHWTDNSNNETGFEVSRTGNLPILVGANVTSAVDTNLQPGTTYCFKVRAKSDIGDSAWTPQVCATTGGVHTTYGNSSLQLSEDPVPYEGAFTYTGHWMPGGRTIADFKSLYNLGEVVLFIMPGHTADECINGGGGIVQLPTNGVLSKAQVDSISYPIGDGSTEFHACFHNVTTVIPGFISVSVDWTE